MLEDEVDLALVTITKVEQPGPVVEPRDLALELPRHERLEERAAEVGVRVDSALVGADELGQKPGVGDVHLRPLDDSCEQVAAPRGYPPDQGQRARQIHHRMPADPP